MLTPPSPDDWPEVPTDVSTRGRRVNVDQLTRDSIQDWQPGENLLLSGKILTGRDAAHKRIADLIAQGQPLPDGVDFNDRLIYYVGPVDPVGEEAVATLDPQWQEKDERRLHHRRRAGNDDAGPPPPPPPRPPAR